VTTRAQQQIKEWSKNAGANIYVEKAPHGIVAMMAWDTGGVNRYEQLTDTQIDRILADEIPTPIKPVQSNLWKERSTNHRCRKCGIAGHDRRNCNR